ncbi:hypothetical protein BJP39_05270 [Streptomyces sp. CC77]|nr:hypothetical protein BJP39_05270 [Streptomyces sp. CC77]
MVGVARVGQRSYYHQATGGQHRQPLTHEVTEATLHLVTDDSTTHGLADDETRTRRGSALPWRVRVRCTAA